MTASSPPDRDARQPPQHRAPRRRAPRRALRRRAPTSAGSTTRTRTDPRSSARSTTTACASRTTRSSPSATAAATVSSPPRSRCTRSCAAARSARATSSRSAPRSTTRPPPTGWQFSTGVCNDKSIGAVVKYMGWKTPGPLPVKLCPPLHTGRGVASDARRRRRSSQQSRFADVTAGLDDFPVRAVDELVHAPSTSAGGSRAPAPASSLHSNDDLVAITTTDTRFGVRAAVILKLFRRAGGADRPRADAIVGAACRFHRAPYAVYAGLQPPGARPRGPAAASAATVAAPPHPAVALTRRRPGHARGRHLRVPRHGRVLMAAGDDGGQVTFTLDLEDHRPSADADERYPALTREVLDFLDARDVRGTFFVVGETAEAHPELVARDRGPRARDRPARLAPPTAHRARRPRRSGPTSTRGKALLEELAGTPVVGFRAPDVLAGPRVALGGRRARRRRVHLLVERAPGRAARCSATRALPTTPFRWPNGLVELPCPVVRAGGLGLPYLGGVYLRAIPGAGVGAGPAQRRARPAAVDLLPPVRLRSRRGVLGRARRRSVRQPPPLVQPAPHVRQDRGHAARPRRSPTRRTPHRGPHRPTCALTV